MLKFSSLKMERRGLTSNTIGSAPFRLEIRGQLFCTDSLLCHKIVVFNKDAVQ